jgi:hypothetical protein
VAGEVEKAKPLSGLQSRPCFEHVSQFSAACAATTIDLLLEKSPNPSATLGDRYTTLTLRPRPPSYLTSLPRFPSLSSEICRGRREDGLFEYIVRLSRTVEGL